MCSNVESWPPRSGCRPTSTFSCTPNDVIETETLFANLLAWLNKSNWIQPITGENRGRQGLGYWAGGFSGQEGRELEKRRRKTRRGDGP